MSRNNCSWLLDLPRGALPTLLQNIPSKSSLQDAFARHRKDASCSRMMSHIKSLDQFGAEVQIAALGRELASSEFVLRAQLLYDTRTCLLTSLTALSVSPFAACSPTRLSLNIISTSGTASRTAFFTDQRECIPSDVTSPSELTHETNKELNCILISACLRNGCCSVGGPEPPQSVSCRGCHRRSCTHNTNLLSVWSHRLSQLIDVDVRCHALIHSVCTNSCTERDLMPDALRLSFGEGRVGLFSQSAPVPPWFSLTKGGVVRSRFKSGTACAISSTTAQSARFQRTYEFDVLCPIRSVKRCSCTLR